VAHGLAVLPGASRVGAALVVLIWIGMRPSRAVELSFLLTVPSLIVAFARGARGGLDPTVTAVAIAVAFLAAIVAAGVLRGMLERRRLSTLALWTIPLGLAMLAYARALPHTF
jgi:undecaprenyl-diphosphatase